jgi:hypothetical protein
MNFLSLISIGAGLAVTGMLASCGPPPVSTGHLSALG